MGVFDKEIQIIKRIEEQIIPTIINTIKKYELILTEYNTDSNLKGEDSTGTQIGKYSGIYKRIRISKGKQVDHVDLNMTGKFHASLDVQVLNDSFKIVSKVSYADDIVKRYGNRVLGIQQKDLEDFVNYYIISELKKMVKYEFTKS
jgi:hypothetical protein